MPKYLMSYRHNETDSPGTLTLDAQDDVDVMAQVRAFVAAGYRNGTSAGVDLSDGTRYRAWDEHGCVRTSSKG